MKNIFRAVIGFILVFVYHIPKLLYILMHLSYAYVFNRQENLTADPKEHLKRAKKHLMGQNSQLLYAALEVRFAVERMAQRELIFCSKIPRKALKQYDPVKKVKSLRRLDENTDFHHKIYLVNKETGERIDWGQYKPLDQGKVARIKGKLGDLLHPKDNLFLGISNDPWYIETKIFLKESIEYLNIVLENNTPFFAYENLDQFVLEKSIENSKNN